MRILDAELGPQRPIAQVADMGLKLGVDDPFVVDGWRCCAAEGAHVVGCDLHYAGRRERDVGIWRDGWVEWLGGWRRVLRCAGAD